MNAISLTANPVRLLGIIGSCIVAVLTALVQQGVLSPDLLKNILSLAAILTPWIMAEFARRKVTPVDLPVLSAGTSVTTPIGEAAIVQLPKVTLDAMKRAAP